MKFFLRNLKKILVARSKPFPLIFIVGPTAVGKSHLALKAALANKGAIVNVDSLQVFNDLSIGTAKPSLQERAKCPHFLFDICELGETFTAGEYRRRAIELITEMECKYPLFFVGGSGFYLQALEKGMYDVEEVPETIKLQVQKEIEVLGLKRVYESLLIQDPNYANSIAPQDKYRIFRAVTLMRTHKQPMSEIVKGFKRQQENHKLNKEIIKIGLNINRQDLRIRVERRVDKMLDDGLVTEVQMLLSKVSENWSPLASVGYKEVRDYVHGFVTYNEMRELIVTHTMQLAKRQMTWFKRDPDVHWFHPIENESAILDFLATRLNRSRT
ncbi:MAG: tRNA (adenosine(37)-N6)-dimethylallyltransferase MiaA [Bdellovibrionales bacterium]|nr:tRNA (adenosine(37)-N6)-dimethylallyltransferase MiaA [Bdellovibrionales bacterium]